MACILLFSWLTPSGLAQPAAVFSEAEEAKKLVVRITGSGIEGAGILVGFDDENLYGVTAKHVIMKRGKIPSDLEGRLRSWRDKLPLKVLKGHPTEDIAAFSISYGGLGLSQGDLGHGLPLEILGSSRDLNGESEIFTIGHGAGGGWIDSREPSRLASHDVSGSRGARMLRFQRYCPGGHSGGAVFDSHWRLVGMITDYEEPFCHALPVESVLAALADWAVEYRLMPASIEGDVPALGKDEVVVAVVDFDNRSGVRMPDIGPAGRDILTSALFSLPGIRLVTRDRLDSVLRELHLNPTVGSMSGISRLGKLLDVDALVTGSVNRYDVERRKFKGYGTSAAKDSYFMSVSLQILDVDTGTVSFSKTYDTSDKRIYNQATSAPYQPLQLESELLDGLLKQEKGPVGDIQLALRQFSAGSSAPIALSVVTYPKDAEVIVGDVYEGRSTLTLFLSIGLHEIEIRSAGYRVWRRQVRVEHDMKPLVVRLER